MLSYRRAQPDDVQLYFTWANDPDTRRQSFNSNPISLATHITWFTGKLTDLNALLLVFENETGKAVGQVRFERTTIVDEWEEVIISLSIDATERGKGLARQLIEQGCAVCRELWGAVAVHAYIKPDNRASVRAFEQAGFRLSAENGKFDLPGRQTSSLVYILET
ncbi:MAG: family N-acetyltransferase [Spirosoma sp.]|nr:family N-acetyltransferase [Spirosoma sp.]